MGKCSLCGKHAITISNFIGICPECLRKIPFSEVMNRARELHKLVRSKYGLPLYPPRGEGDKVVKCTICINECSIPPKQTGFCGYWVNNGGKLEPLYGFDHLFLEYYLDPLPTNCVATPVCPAATGRGYPKYAVSPHAEHGFYNLAVFLSACNLDCLFCQNYIYKKALAARYREYVKHVNELIEAAKNSRVTCVCYFGGDPTPFAPQLIEVSRKIIDNSKGSIKRICWETNGLVNPKIMEKMALLSLESGGIVKIDWKCYDPNVYTILTGVDGRKAIERIKENIRLIARLSKERPEVPLLVVSTLLVPGYVSIEDVRSIAKFLASIDSSIPYILLAFHPDHYLRDLPPTSYRHAREAVNAAKEAGLENVFLENVWLLGPYY